MCSSGALCSSGDHTYISIAHTHIYTYTCILRNSTRNDRILTKPCLGLCHMHNVPLELRAHKQKHIALQATLNPTPAHNNIAHHNHCTTNTPQCTALHSPTPVANQPNALPKPESLIQWWCIVIESTIVQCGWIETAAWTIHDLGYSNLQWLRIMLSSRSDCLLVKSFLVTSKNDSACCFCSHFGSNDFATKGAQPALVRPETLG